MSNMFIEVVRDIRGSGDIDSINSAVGNPLNAGLPASFTDGGIYQRIKDKEAHVEQMRTEVDGIATNIYGTDPVNGSTGSIWKDIIDRSNQVSLDKAAVSADAAAVAAMAGNEYEAEAAKRTAKSYADEDEDVEVREYYSNGDGTYGSVVMAGVYSSKHWNAKAQHIGAAHMEHYNQVLEPTATQLGATWFNTSTMQLKIWTLVGGVGEWVNIAAGSQESTNETTFVATASQSDFPVTYDLTSIIQVYRNGVKLDGSMFDATTGHNVVLFSPADAGNIINVVEITQAISCGCTSTGGGGGIEHYDQESTPSPSNTGATWYQPSTNKVFKYVFDGASYAWVDISAGLNVLVQSIIETKFIATSGQTVFMVNYDTVNSKIFVFVNGILSDRDTYDATTGTRITFNSGLNANDIVLVQELKQTPAPVSALGVLDYIETVYEPVAPGTDTFAVSYDLSDVIEVYRNGFKLVPSNYVANNGSTVVLNTPTAGASETIEIVVIKLTGTVSNEECNLIINGRFELNSRGAANKLDTSKDPLGEYSYDMWCVVAGNLQQRIEDGKYTPNTEYTLSGDNIITQQITSPAGGTWTVDTGTSDPNNVVLNKGNIIRACQYNIENEIRRAGEYYKVVPFIYKGGAIGKITQSYHTGGRAKASASVIQEVEYFGGLPERTDGIYVDYEYSENGDTLFMFTRDFLEDSQYDFRINIIFDASL